MGLVEPVRGGGLVGGAVGPNGKWSSSSLDSSSGAWRSAEGGLFVLVLVPVRGGGEVGGASSLDSISGACRSIGGAGGEEEDDGGDVGCPSS